MFHFEIIERILIRFSTGGSMVLTLKSFLMNIIFVRIDSNNLQGYRMEFHNFSKKKVSS